MAEIYALTDEQKQLVADWIKECPGAITEMVASHPGNKLYKMKQTGQRCEIHAYSEDRTVTVLITGKYNRLICDRTVYGVPIDDLEECDLPGPDEPLGSLLTEQKGIDAYVEAIRPQILAQMAKNTRREPSRNIQN